MKVCIGIATYNRCEVLPKAIEFALQQDYSDKVIFVADDASTDATDTLRSRFPEVRWYRFDSNVGYRDARNHLMRHADADLYISLDDDSWFLSPTSISDTVAIFVERPQLAALGFDILREMPASVDATDQSLVKARTFIGCGHALRLPFVREVGFYCDLPMSYGAEEVDLCLRLLDAGYEVLRTNEIKVWHEKSLTERDVRSLFAQAVCNVLGVTVTRYPLGYLAVVLPVQLIRNLLLGLFFALKRQSSRSKYDAELVRQHGRWVYLLSGARGILQFVRALPAILASRRPVSYRTFTDFLRRSR